MGKAWIFTRGRCVGAAGLMSNLNRVSPTSISRDNPKSTASASSARDSGTIPLGCHFSADEPEEAGRRLFEVFERQALKV